ncbi:hypothetical protein JTE90_014616 [Oedothorax gibbosus]|uniref:Uncharacterized protein n=1 Tax=Oedothorax gibbosus TaxID=931172 RepID=A0AAV6VB02_9ARAC|nr:hypothetical protein JTE90_014616 [Oedothorax gibbosus]
MHPNRILFFLQFASNASTIILQTGPYHPSHKFPSLKRPPFLATVSIIWRIGRVCMTSKDGGMVYGPPLALDPSSAGNNGEGEECISRSVSFLYSATGGRRGIGTDGFSYPLHFMYKILCV